MKIVKFFGVTMLNGQRSDAPSETEKSTKIASY